MLRAGMPVGPLIARLDAHTRDHRDPLIARLLAAVGDPEAFAGPDPT